MLSLIDSLLPGLMHVNAIQKCSFIYDLVVVLFVNEVEQIDAVGEKIFQPGDTVLYDVFLVFRCAEQSGYFVNQTKRSFKKLPNYWAELFRGPGEGELQNYTNKKLTLQTLLK